MRFQDIREEAKKARAALVSVGAEETPPDWRFRTVAQMKMLLKHSSKAHNRQMFSLICRENAYAHPISAGPALTHAVEFIPEGVELCNVCGEPVKFPVLYAGNRLCQDHEQRTRDMVSIPVPMFV